jgi:hypothetical protein
MANLSYNVTTAIIEGHEDEPDEIAVGTAAPTTGKAVELRVDLSLVKSNHQIIRALHMFIRRLEDGRLGSNDTGLV